MRIPAQAVREHLNVDIRFFVPAVATALEALAEAAGAIEDQQRAIGAILLRPAERRIGRVVVPHELLAFFARNFAPQSPDAEAVSLASVDRKIQTAKIQLPDAQARAEIVVTDDAVLSRLGDEDVGIVVAVRAFREGARGHRSQVLVRAAEIQADILKRVA